MGIRGWTMRLDCTINAKTSLSPGAAAWAGLCSARHMMTRPRSPKPLGSTSRAARSVSNAFRHRKEDVLVWIHASRSRSTQVVANASPAEKPALWAFTQSVFGLTATCTANSEKPASAPQPRATNSLGKVKSNNRPSPNRLSAGRREKSLCSNPALTAQTIRFRQALSRGVRYSNSWA